MHDRPIKYTRTHVKKEKKNTQKHTQSSKIYSVVKIAQCGYRISHCRNCENRLAQQIV